MIFTSYFGGLRKFYDIYVAKQIVPISIALYQPTWYRGLTFPELAPTKEILYDYKEDPLYKLDKEHYIEAYHRDILGRPGISPEQVIHELEVLAGNRKTLLFSAMKSRRSSVTGISLLSGLSRLVLRQPNLERR